MIYPEKRNAYWRFFMQKTRCALAVGLAMVAGVAWAVVPQVSPDVQKATETIYKDPVMQKMLTELTSDENAQFRKRHHDDA